ncbi:serine/threonine-protein kinase [Microbacterium trichothecenolyticum]|uniref:non-specific serine/threonine protein kinase n=1 Tax=Microbacterium trichothecenolyticum TaxID=69370 RepID=A0ABU0TT47_MICTR|nr:serine/threonine-protein kinase [Microbacterium trichothecenolyticum]MDQ1122847.1 serine/threonine protein kinase [Microbacterium trichothecenolyticum]
MTEPTPTVPYDPAVDDLFDGRYRLGRVIGRGGYARVYEAEDTSLGRTVALKVIDGDGADPDDAARVRSEIRLLASLAHPSLVTLYDARLSSAPAYLSMELIAGPTLSDLIARGPLAGEEVARAGREIAEALAVIHGRGIVHRDVKPSNILVRPAAHHGESPRATLADFGIASLVGATRVTRAGAVVGTAAYLSPEQARGMPAVPASDVYALGLVLLEALTGTRAFAGRTPHESLAARLVAAPEIPPAIPAPWRDVLERMTAVDPAERPDAADLIVALRPLADVALVSPSSRVAVLPGATGPTRVLDVPTSPRRRRPSRRVVIVASVVAALLIGGCVSVAVATADQSAQPALPSLPQPLDQHIDDLWKEVGP